MRLFRKRRRTEEDYEPQMVYSSFERTVPDVVNVGDTGVKALSLDLADGRRVEVMVAGERICYARFADDDMVEGLTSRVRRIRPQAVPGEAVDQACQALANESSPLAAISIAGRSSADVKDVLEEALLSSTLNVLDSVYGCQVRSVYQVLASSGEWDSPDAVHQVEELAGRMSLPAVRSLEKDLASRREAVAGTLEEVGGPGRVLEGDTTHFYWSVNDYHALVADAMQKGLTVAELLGGAYGFDQLRLLNVVRQVDAFGKSRDMVLPDVDETQDDDLDPEAAEDLERPGAAGSPQEEPAFSPVEDDDLFVFESVPADEHEGQTRGTGPLDPGAVLSPGVLPEPEADALRQAVSDYEAADRRLADVEPTVLDLQRRYNGSVGDYNQQAFLVEVPQPEALEPVRDGSNTLWSQLEKAEQARYEANSDRAAALRRVAAVLEGVQDQAAQVLLDHVLASLDAVEDVVDIALTSDKDTKDAPEQASVSDLLEALGAPPPGSTPLFDQLVSQMGNPLGL